MEICHRVQFEKKLLKGKIRNEILYNYILKWGRLSRACFFSVNLRTFGAQVVLTLDVLLLFGLSFTPSDHFHPHFHPVSIYPWLTQPFFNFFLCSTTRIISNTIVTYTNVHVQQIIRKNYVIRMVFLGQKNQKPKIS